MDFGTTVVLALDSLEASPLASGKLCVVGILDLCPVHVEVHAVIPDEILLFLVVGRAKFPPFALLCTSPKARPRRWVWLYRRGVSSVAMGRHTIRSC